ncbi:MAG: lysophospholipid acyltransferase family protein [Candidatus Riflebacteria bacterium]|nr:lysophospholipid acyltransferase family protein [Candidatus Riflebacteria bacterium]
MNSSVITSGRPPLSLRFKAMLLLAMIIVLNSLLRIDKTGSITCVEKGKLDRPFLIASWHGTLMIPLYCFRGLNLVIMSSLSQDGELMAMVIDYLKYLTVRGSSSRGGAKGLLEMIRMVKAGHSAALTVDGPRGPRHEVKPGMVMVAQKSGAYIMPIGVACSRCLTLKNWDQTKIPLPFSRVVMHVGSPFTIPADASIDEGCEMIRQGLFASTQQAEIQLNNGKLSEV